MGIEEAILEDVKQQGIEIGIKRGVKKGIAVGVEKGILDAKTQIIANGIQQGLSVATLAGLTELSEEDINAIVLSLQKKALK